MGGQHGDAEGLNLTLDDEDGEDASGLVPSPAAKRAKIDTVLSEAEVCRLLETDQQGAASLQRTVRCMMASLFVMWPDLSPTDMAAKAWRSLLPDNVQEAATPPEGHSSGCSSGSAQQLFADLVHAELQRCAAVLVALMGVSRSRAEQCASEYLQPWGPETIEQLRAGGLLQRRVVVVHDVDDANHS